MQETHELRHGTRVGADNLSWLFRRGLVHCQYLDLRSNRYRLSFHDRLCFRRHDSFERGISRFVQSLLCRDHHGKRGLDDIVPAFDLTLANYPAVLHFDLYNHGDGGEPETLGNESGNLLVVVIDRLFAEEDTVRRGLLKFFSKCYADRK